MKITDSVYMLDCTPQSHAYLILEPEILLVDTCLPGKGKKIVEEIQSLHIDPKQIKHILLTHHDADHTGSAAMLEETTGAAIWASAEDIPYITRQKSPSGTKKFISLIMKIRQPTCIHPYPDDGQMGEVKIIPAPGHTPGHVCLLYRDVLLAGDLVVTSHGKIKPSPGFMTWNTPVLMESIQKISVYPFKWICPAHGMPVERGDQL